MNRIRLGALMVAVGVSCSMWACGDDDDDSENTAGTGGKAGSSTGGTAGKGGNGTAGKGGANTAGKGGNGPDLGGAGGTDVIGGGGGTGGGAAGEPGIVGGGGVGGSEGGMGGDGGTAGGGMGGEGGAPPAELTLEQACSLECDVFFTGHPDNCDTAGEADCNVNCSNYFVNDDVAEALFLTYTRCAADQLTASADYACASEFPDITATPMFPVAGGACETDFCLWVCADGNSSTSSDVYVRCGC